MAETFERREVKFLINRTQLLDLEEALTPYMIKNNFGRYTICNIFYDTPDYHLITTSIARPPFKQKLRLRTYYSSGVRSDTYLELKKKLDHIVYKRRIPITDGSVPENPSLFLRPDSADLSEREISWFCRQFNGLAPRIFLSYNRSAYVSRTDPNLRITFDNNIRWRTSHLDFDSGTAGNLLMDYHQSVMEVKIDESIPLWLVSLLSSLNIRKTTFSKVGSVYQQMLKYHQERTGSAYD